jgi:23S rRNA G2445 N2-methylase RlmL
MKKTFLLFIVTAVLLSSCQAQKINSHLQKFSQQFATANMHLLGHLMLFGDYKGNLSTLTYEKYLILLKENELYSTKDVAKIVQQTDQHLFIAKDSTFYVVIYSKKMNAVVFDEPTTSFCDSIKILQQNEVVPELKTFIREKKQD